MLRTQTQHWKGTRMMANRQYSSEDIIPKPHEADALFGQGEIAPEVAKQPGVVEQTCAAG
jgi:hypothetical protein